MEAKEQTCDRNDVTEYSDNTRHLAAGQLHTTIDHWLNSLQGYSRVQLCHQPSAGTWSLGQLYLHLIKDTRFFFEQVGTCVKTNDHRHETASPQGQQFLVQRALPDMRLEGATSNALIPQPTGKEMLGQGLLQLKSAIDDLNSAIHTSTYFGKTRHPGLGYFSAAEWFRFAEMHFRHHIRQQQRIELTLRLEHVA